MENTLLYSTLPADNAQASPLQTTLTQLFSTQSRKLHFEQGVTVAVIALQRYLSDQTDGRLHQQNDSYDVTLTDGTWQTKCLLDSSLNHLVHRNVIRTGIDISISACSFIYDERRLGHGHIYVENVKCAKDASDILPTVYDVDSIPVLTIQGFESMALRTDVPLQVCRKHYLSLWNNDDPEGNVWTSHAPTSDVVLDVSKITLLCDLESAFRNVWKPLPLLVRIIHKSRLRYYGKVGIKIDYPYQAYFEVADQSGTMSLVLWNELCPQWYKILNVGTVLYIQNYTVKQSYSNRTHPQMDHNQLRVFNSVEICLNPHNPAANLTVVSTKNVHSQWGLPEAAYQFTTRSELDNLCNNSACDVIGLVTFVGRVERVKNKGNIGPEKFWSYRWVHAVDGTSNHPFILEIFSSSQSEIFNSICPMTYLVCTQMRVFQVEGSLPYLTSSCETQIFITGYHKGQPYVSDPKVKSFIQWTKTLKDSVILQKTIVGGHYRFPQAPQMLTQPMADGSGQIPLFAAADLKREMQSLQYREHKRLAIQGQIISVRYLKSQRTDTAEGPDLSATIPEDTLPGPHSSNRMQSLTRQETAPSADKVSASKRKRIHRIAAQHSYITRLKLKSRLAGRLVEEDGSGSEQEPDKEPVLQRETCTQDRPAGPRAGSVGDILSWQSSNWPKQLEDVSEHLCQDGLFQDSLAQKFTFEEKDRILQHSNLPLSKWTPDQSSDDSQPVICPGYFQATILGINKNIAIDAVFFPVMWSGDPRAVGLTQQPHGNTMLSCLSSGFFCPLVDSLSQGDTTCPDPEEILATAEELEDTHVVCVLDICHLGGDKVEVLINNVYKVTLG